MISDEHSLSRINFDAKYTKSFIFIIFHESALSQNISIVDTKIEICLLYALSGI